MANSAENIMASATGWVVRKTGWSGSREQWLVVGVLLYAIAAMFVRAQYLSKLSLSANLFWTAMLLVVPAVVFAKPLRDLFGPVFFYDLMRTSRKRSTFVLRGFYVVFLGAFLALMYYNWIQTSRWDSGYYYRRNSSADGQFRVFLGVSLILLGYTVYRLTEESWAVAVRAIMMVIAVLLGLWAFLAALEDFQNVGKDAVTTVPSSSIARFATGFFETFVIVQFVVMTMLVPVYVADTIAVEKEKKTLEFLLATDLRNREIIFGKLASRVLTLVLYVLAGLPILAFLQLFGGIDPEQLLAATVTTVVFVIGLSCLAVWMSTSLKRARDAIAMTYMLILAYLFLSVMLAGYLNFSPPGWWNRPVNVLGWSVGLHDVATRFAEGNPVWGIMKLQSRGAARMAGFSGNITDIVGEFLRFWLVAGSLLLGAAIVKVRRTALLQAYGGKVRRAAVHPKAVAAGEANAPGKPNFIIRLFDGTSGRPEIGDNPVTWKEVFVDSTYKTNWVGSALAVVLLVLIFLWPVLSAFSIFFDETQNYYRNMSRGERWYKFSEQISMWTRIATGVIGFLILMSATIRGAGSIVGERDKDTWISLAATPLSAADILAGKFWGCVLSLRRAYVILAIIWGFALATDALRPGMIPILVILVAVYVSVFSLVGISCSIGARSSQVASVRGFFAAIFCAGGFWIVVAFGCLMPLAWSSRDGRLTEQLSSFFIGWTPPFMLGFMPLNHFEDLGPFADKQYTAGWFGPIVGTGAWILIGLYFANLCHHKLSVVLNREVTEGRDPARRRNRETENDSRDSEDADS